MRKILRYTIIVALIATIVAIGNSTPRSGENNIELALPSFQEPDTIRLEENIDLKYSIKDAGGNPLLEQEEKRGLDLSDPSNLEYKAEYDYKTGQMTLYRKVGDINVRLPYTMSLEEYMNYDTRKSIMSYWRTKELEESNRNGDGSFMGQMLDRVGGNPLEGIFGKKSVNVRLQGLAELKIGIQTTNIENPTLQERLRKTTTFDFQEKIQMNLSGSIGDKLKLGVNYNTEATFDFENQMNLEYEGGEDDILKKVEAGNVTLPLPGTLITGSQSLFGVKTEMQFGKLTVTSIFSQQKGETKVMNIEGGAETQDFEIHADQYDRNRHFFLSEFFRDRYNDALKQLPFVNSKYNITRVEVWVTNRQSAINESRNVVAFVDLGESAGFIHNDKWKGTTIAVPDNEANTLYQEMNGTYSNARDINQVTSTLNGVGNGFNNAIDYEKLENARKLSSTEYSFHPKLGYISLNTSLNADEVLCVAYEYTESGQRHMVGEFTNDQNKAENALYLKMLKGTNLSPNMPTWNLMMKNIYSINAYQVNREDFELNVTYTNDSTGSDINYLPEGPESIQGELFIRLLNLDKLNSQNDYQPDGIFDFVENLTIKPENGRIIFPVLEPFGKDLAAILPGDLAEKYVFQSLYDETQVIAEQDASKNKFKLKGRYKSSSGSEISLNAMNVPQGSVIVTAGGIKLVENQDYTVDYTLGRVHIINQGLLSSGTPIQVSLENQSLFNMQTKTLMGTHLDYKINENFNIGGTLMHLREKPLTQKVNIGDEPIANTIWGLNTSFYTESMGLTELLDKLPLVQTKEKSSITFEGEFAQLVPGHPDVIEKTGTSYIDDFEGSRIPYDMRNWMAWQLASVPQGQSDKGDLFEEGALLDDIRSGNNRAQFAWFSIDPLFLRTDTRTPGHIKADEDQKKNHFVREVFEKELFPEKDLDYGQPSNMPVLNISFYPKERGPYNFDTKKSTYSEGVDFNGELLEPEKRWGGMMRKIDINDFESANIEYLEFWMMDPYVYDDDFEENDGNIYFNFGNVSEDILRDARKSFENGLPVPGEPFEVDETQFGYVSRKQNLVNGFSTDPAARVAQDVGLDGMNSSAEKDFYRKSPYPFLDLIDQMSGELSSEAYQRLMDDPSSDDFHYFRGSDFDQQKTSILDRYKHFNNPEGNSKSSEFSGESYSTAAKSLPDVEDINGDNTLSENESYFQYKVPISKKTMSIEQNPYIVDMRLGKEADNDGIKANWYLFRIPLGKSDKREEYGAIQDLRSIRFMRMFLRGFKDTVHLRMATLDLVKSDWRRFTKKLDKDAPNDLNTEFEVSVVNIEESTEKEPVNYVLPPGIDRVIDPANPQIAQLNEQALSLKVTDLTKNDSRAVYKNVSIDVRQYKRLKMFIHAEALEGYDLKDNQMKAFIRIGSDYTDNYYEYEIPLKLTKHRSNYTDSYNDRREVWPEENEINLPFDLFQTVKLRRNDAKRIEGSDINFNDVHEMIDPDNPLNRVYVRGNPNLSNVRTITLGVRNRGSETISVELWMNELRLTDFNEEGGWAANGRMSVKLADLGNVSVAGKMSTVGWGSIDQSVQERSQEDFQQVDVATNLELGKFLGPESKLSMPFYFGYSKSVATPKYYPLDPDIPMDVALENAGSSAARDSIKQLSESLVTRKSVNFTNVKLKPKREKVHFYSPSNLSATYSYNETYKRDVNTERSVDRNYRGILAYNYNARPKPVEPFKKALKSKSLALIRDFNFYYLPAQVSYRWEFDRRYYETQLRNNTGSPKKPDLTVSKDFEWKRNFDMRYNLTKALKLNFRAQTNARIDEPEGAVDKKRYRDQYEEWKKEVWNNIQSFGRTTTYQHNFDVSYTLPINKFPMLDFTSANLQYRGTYQWEAAPRFNKVEGKASPKVGSTIQNSNTVQGNGQLNMLTLYKKVPYLKELDRKYRSSRRSSSNRTGKRTVRFNKTNVALVANAPLVINHKLKTMETSMRVFDEKGRPVKGKVTVLGKNKVEFIPEKSVEKARIMVNGTLTENNSPFQKVVDYTALMLTSVKNINVAYSENNGTILPGYTQDADFMGSTSGFTAPGMPFILGIQDRSFGVKAAKKGWLTTDKNVQNPFVMTHREDFSLKFTLEPIKGLRIDLNADRSYSRNLNEYYIGGESLASGRTANGNFSMSFNAFRTAFDRPDKAGALYSETFEEFKSNRQIIANRLGLTGNDMLNSQEVMIPAFLAAYSGQDANSIFTEQFPSISKIQPNWRVTYDGLSRIKALKKLVKSFDLSHSYRSTYNMGAYVSETPKEKYDPITYYDVNTITISEQFNPLIAFNVTWVNSITTRMELKKDRTLSLSMGNNQVIENYNDEFVIGLGYRFDKMNLIFGKGSSQKSVSNDLNIRADFTIQDNISYVRKLEENYNQLTAGTKVTSFKLTADYALSDRFNMQVYYDTKKNTPYISTTYPITNSNFGVSFRFTLTQ